MKARLLDITALLENLRELAEKDLQEKLWVHGDEEHMSSFAEAICDVFDGAGLARALETGHMEKYFSRGLCLKAQNLDQLVGAIPEYLPPGDIIEHPKMKK